MIVSTRGRYALHVMIALAKHGKDEFVPLKEIAEEQSIPHKYTESIMTALVKAGLAEGSRGKNGGYRLSREPKDITAAEILNETENSFAAVSCTEREATECPQAGKCPTLPMWRALDETVNEFLSRYTLADLIGKK